MKPEEKAEIVIWDWLKTKSQYVEEIYFNRKNKLGCKTFSVQGNIRKPDLIIKFNSGFGMKYVVVEVKSSKHSKNILDSRKIIDYYFLYVRKETKYFINDEEIKIDHFIIATENSKLGYLFKNEKLIDNLEDKESKSKHYATSIGIIPRFEGNRTFEFVRGLWNWFKDIRKEFEIKCGLGILIADVNDNNKPKMMISSYNENKKRWGQRFWNL